MPLIEAGFSNKQGGSDLESLVKYGPTVQVIVGHLKTEGSPSKETETVNALVDTGASESCIDISIAKRLKLPAVDIQKISGVGGTKEHPVYMAHIVIPSLMITQYGRFTGVDLIAGGQPHSVLLGRTFLRDVIMIYDGLRGHVTIASSVEIK